MQVASALFVGYNWTASQFPLLPAVVRLFRPEEMPVNQEAKRWLIQANEDLETADILLSSERFGPCAFYCQQAAEKALKGA